MVRPDTTVTLTSEALHLTRTTDNGREELFSCDLAEYGEVRKSVGNLIWVLAESVPEATAHVCSKCGVCCRRPVIEVNAQDIFRMARSLGFAQDDEFRSTYVEPLPTSWNPEHGMLRHTSDGNCVFLETESGGHTTRCSIYEDRPRSCRDFTPDHPSCIKQAVKLIQHFKRVEIQGETIRIVNDRDQTTEVSSVNPNLKPALVALGKVLQRLDFELRKRYAKLQDEAQRKLDTIESHLASLDPAELRKRLASVGKLLARMKTLAEEMGTDEAPLDDMVDRLDHLKKCTAAPPVVADVSLLRPGVQGLIVSSTGIMLTGQNGADQLRWEAHPDMAPLGQTVMQALVTWDRPDLQTALKEDDPPCFRCGECCRHYSVEIHPYDIERLAVNLGVTEDTVIRKYTEKPVFAWNPGNRVLKKKKMADGKPGCVFLERRDDGFWYCGVHPFKPDVCRSYTPTNGLCQQMNQIKFWPRMIDSIAWLLFTDRTVMVATHRSLAGRQPPLELRVAEHLPLLQAVQRLTAQLATFQQ